MRKDDGFRTRAVLLVIERCPIHSDDRHLITPSRTSRRALFLLTTDLVVPKKWTPGATAEQEGVHERSFGLDGVVQIVSGPGVQHLRQRDRTQSGMLSRPAQIVIRHPFE